MEKDRVIRGRYQLIRALQTGPLTTTHLAEDSDTGVRVVLKEIAVHARAYSRAPEDLFKRLELLEREGKILKHLDHPRIPRFIDAFRIEEEGRLSLWLVQEYREGRNLREAIDDGWHGSAADVERILREVAEILGHLHGRVPPIVHRDVKPANIVLEPDGSVCLVDLGAACTRVLSQKEGSTIIGTPGYVPLEQFAGQAVPASDVYALGMVGVYLVTHTEPLELTGDDGRVRYRHLTSVDHPTLLDTIDRMTEPLVSERLSSVREVLASLDGTHETMTAPPPEPQQPARPGYWLGAVAAILGCAGLIFGAAAFLDERSAAPGEIVAPGLFMAEEAISQIPYDPPPEEPLPSETVTELPSCSVSLDGEPLAHCARHTSMLEPMVMGPGRIRALLDELPEELEEPELRGWLEGDDVAPLWVVDFTLSGAELVGPIGCPMDSEPVAAALAADGSYHLACTDHTDSIEHVMLDVNRGLSRKLGSFALDYDEYLEPALTADYDELDDSDARPVLAVPERGPALLIYPAYSTMDDSPSRPRVQPLARGARAFYLFSSSQLEDVGEWQLYEEGGRIFAVVHARSKRDGMHRLYRVRVSSIGSELLGRLELPTTESDELVCHGLSTATTPTGLVFRAPNEFGDRQLGAVIAGGRAIPGPSAAHRDANVCADVTSVIVRRGASKLELQHGDMLTTHHRVACAGQRCLLAYTSVEGLEVVRLELP